jgi:hypothetical protein
MPGRHVWIARLPGGAVARFEQEARAGDLPSVDLVFGLPPPAPEEVEELPPCPPAHGERMGPELCKLFRRAPPPVEELPPCPAADGERMGPKACELFMQIVYNRRVNPTVGVVLGGLLSVGYTADPAPGLFGGVELRWADTPQDAFGFVLTGDVRVLFPTRAGNLPLGGVLNLTQVTAGLAPCLRYKWVLGCAVFDAGASIKGEPPDVKAPDHNPFPNIGIGPRLGLDLPIFSRFGVRAFADLQVSPLQPFYRANGLLVWQAPPVSGLFGLGVSFK